MLINKLILIIATLMAIGIQQGKAAFAAEPFGYDELLKYGQSSVFDATVPLWGCSASRIEIDKDDSLDFYVTALHCGIPMLDTHFSALGGLKKMLTIPMDSLGLVGDQKRIIGYMPHPKLDLAIFATQKTNQPRYSLYKGRLDDLVNHQVTNVGFGVRLMSVMGILDDFLVGPKRQAFNTIIRSVQQNLIYSKPFVPKEYIEDDMQQLVIGEDYLPGLTTGGDSGGSLLIKKEDGYQLIGTTNARMEDIYLLDKYHAKIPKELKSNFLYPLCRRLNTCYGCYNWWTGVNLDFIKNAKEEFLSMIPVYYYPSKGKMGSPVISFELKNNGSLEEKRDPFLGYVSPASKYAKIVVFVNGEELMTIPWQLGHIQFVYQSAGKEYPIEIAIEKTADEKSCIIKTEVLPEDHSKAYRPEDEFKMDKNKQCNAFSFPARITFEIERSDECLEELPLKIALDECVSKKNFIDTDLLEIVSLGNQEKVLSFGTIGYGKNNYEVVVSLGGQEIKRISKKELSLIGLNFPYKYNGNMYIFTINKLVMNKVDCIKLVYTLQPKASQEIVSHRSTNSAENSDSEPAKVSVKCKFLSESGRALARDLSLKVDLMEAGISDGNKLVFSEDVPLSGGVNSVVRLLVDSKVIGYLELNEKREWDNSSFQFEKGGQRYYIGTAVVEGRDGKDWKVFLDVEPIIGKE